MCWVLSVYYATHTETVWFTHDVVMQILWTSSGIGLWTMQVLREQVISVSEQTGALLGLLYQPEWLGDGL